MTGGNETEPCSLDSLGGGMFNRAVTELTVANCTFTANWAFYGGGIYTDMDSSVEIVSCAFTANSANWGGGIFVGSGSPSVTDCVFTANSAVQSGGGMYNNMASSPAITNCRFTQNSTTHGSGGGMSNWWGSSPEITDCVFTENTASYNGGGMANGYCLPVITNCTFEGNSTTGSSGGGMHNLESLAVIVNCVFRGNSGGTRGGGMCNEFGRPAIMSCTFTGNSAATRGGAICEMNYSFTTVTNCILWDNTAPEGPELYVYGTSSPAVTYSCVGQAGYTDGPGNHNINADPLFVDPANGDLHLQEASPCIDAGTADGAPDHDLDGYPRPSGWGVDMGAYEQRNGYDETFTITSDVALSATFETVEQGTWADYGCHPKGAYFFSTASEFASFYSTLRGNMLPPPAPPTIDFTRYRVVAVVDDCQVSTGYSVEVTSVELDSGDQYIVTAHFTEPTGLVGCAITKPYHIVKVGVRNSTVVLSESNNGSTEGIHVGDTLQIELRGNPSTGYEWEVGYCDASILEQVGVREYEQDPQPDPGHPAAGLG